MPRATTAAAIHPRCSLVHNCGLQLKPRASNAPCAPWSPAQVATGYWPFRLKGTLTSILALSGRGGRETPGEGVLYFSSFILA